MVATERPVRGENRVHTLSQDEQQIASLVMYHVLAEIDRLGVEEAAIRLGVSRLLVGSIVTLGRAMTEKRSYDPQRIDVSKAIRLAAALNLSVIREIKQVAKPGWMA